MATQIDTSSNRVSSFGTTTTSSETLTSKQTHSSSSSVPPTTNTRNFLKPPAPNGCLTTTTTTTTTKPQAPTQPPPNVPTTSPLIIPPPPQPPQPPANTNGCEVEFQPNEKTSLVTNGSSGAPAILDDVKVQCYYCGLIMVVYVSAHVSIEEFFGLLREICKFEAGQLFTLKWVDEEGDPCTLSSQCELDEALRLYYVNKESELVVHVFANIPERPGTQCAGEDRSIYRRGARRWRKLYLVNGHKYQAKRFARTALCKVCNDRIWGLGRQGYKCLECKIMVHKRCHKFIHLQCAEILAQQQQQHLNSFLSSSSTTSTAQQMQQTQTITSSSSSNSITNSTTTNLTSKTNTTSLQNQHQQPQSQSLIDDLKQAQKQKNKHQQQPVESKKSSSGIGGPQQQTTTTNRSFNKPSKSTSGGENRKENGDEMVASGTSRAGRSANEAMVSESSSSSTSGRQIGLEHFNLLQVIGRGSYAKVFLVEYKRTRKLYAMKVINKSKVNDDEDIDWVQTEKHVFEQATNHPFLVGLHSCFQNESRLFFVIEYLCGGDLMYHMQRKRRLPEDHARFYSAEICVALGFLHSKGIIYRDLKLDNVLLDIEGHVKLTDYGMCKEGLGRGEKTGTFCGTPNYIAPEMLRGDDYDFSVDWWALGVLLYEMMAGRSPFEPCNNVGDNMTPNDNPDLNTEDHLFQVILEKPIRIPRSLSVKAASVLKSFLNKQPSERLGSTEGLAEIRQHQFFRPIDWTQLEQRLIQPPYRPPVSHERDLANIDELFTREPTAFTPETPNTLARIQQNEFDGFEYINPLILSDEAPV